jgi:hypothetical protein
MRVGIATASIITLAVLSCGSALLVAQFSSAQSGEDPVFVALLALLWAGCTGVFSLATGVLAIVDAGRAQRWSWVVALICSTVAGVVLIGAVVAAASALDGALGTTTVNELPLFPPFLIPLAALLYLLLTRQSARTAAESPPSR